MAQIDELVETLQDVITYLNRIEKHSRREAAQLEACLYLPYNYLDKVCNNGIAKFAAKRGGKVDSEKTKKLINGRIEPFDLPDAFGLKGMICYKEQKKYIGYTAGAVFELISPGKHRGIYGNIYIFKFWGFSFADIPIDGAMIAATGHLLERFAERYIKQELSRTEQIREFIKFMIQNNLLLDVRGEDQDAFWIIVKDGIKYRIPCITRHSLYQSNSYGETRNLVCLAKTFLPGE